ncbi:large adhesin [Streptomyces malaysiensis subsp. malaysiensis]|nr:large adhesin [Streptomyces malaysiensis]
MGGCGGVHFPHPAPPRNWGLRPQPPAPGARPRDRPVRHEAEPWGSGALGAPGMGGGWLRRGVFPTPPLPETGGSAPRPPGALPPSPGLGPRTGGASPSYPGGSAPKAWGSAPGAGGSASGASGPVRGLKGFVLGLRGLGTRTCLRCRVGVSSSLSGD